MSRPTGDSDKRLIQAALELLDQTGFSGLKLRQVAAKAKVNLGMFHYHFKSKEEFEARILSEAYEKMFAQLSLGSAGADSPLERLHLALLVFARFTRENRRVVLGLVHDVTSGHKGILEFGQKNIPRHFKVLYQLIQECQKAGELIKMDTFEALVFLMASINLPHMVAGLLEKTQSQNFFPMKWNYTQKHLISDEAMGRRIDLALKALRK